jgi:hypothetical protein
MITLGGIVFWTGRFTAQADMYQQLQAKQSSDIKSNTDANAKQDVTLGVIGQQYLEISRRLNSIEGKLDERH